MTDDTALIRACAEIVGADEAKTDDIDTEMHFSPQGTILFNDEKVLIRTKMGRSHWNPLTDEHASARLVEKMVEDGWYLRLDSFAIVGRTLWEARFRHMGDDGLIASDPDRKRAIAEAAAKCFEKGEE
jgi:hypothetical protein